MRGRSAECAVSLCGARSGTVQRRERQLYRSVVRAGLEAPLLKALLLLPAARAASCFMSLKLPSVCSCHGVPVAPAVTRFRCKKGDTIVMGSDGGCLTTCLIRTLRAEG